MRSSPAQILPLLCPVREDEWLPGWKGGYELVYSESGFNEEGCVFRLYKSFGAEAIWTCLVFDETAYQVVFHICVRDMMVYRFSISLAENDEGPPTPYLIMSIRPFPKRGMRLSPGTPTRK